MRAAWPWILAVALVVALPSVFPSNAALTIMNQIAITVVFALSYNMLLGQAGLLSFGHAVYMGLGGFFVLHMMNWVADSGFWVPLPLLPLFAGFFGLGAATIIGAFSVQRAGTVFAMISLGIGELIAACSLIIVAFFGGEEGVSADRTLGTSVLGIEWFTRGGVYWVIAGWALASALAMYLFSQTAAGRMANAVRDNPERAAFLGYDPRQVRFASFCASGFFAGVAGGLFAINYEIMTEENLNLVTSGTILLIAFLGGVGFFAGPVVGAIVFTLLQSVLSLHTGLWQLYAGLLFVVTVMVLPSGLAGLFAMHRAAWSHGRAGDLLVPYLRVLVPGIGGALGLAAFTEILHHARHAALGDDAMRLFWIDISVNNPLVWAISAGTAVTGFWLARQRAGEMKAAYDDASRPGAPS